jgi:hypothetical protein
MVGGAPSVEDARVSFGPGGVASAMLVTTSKVRNFAKGFFLYERALLEA